MSVIAITGTMGSGKSTIAQALSQQFSCAVLCEDEFNPAFSRSAQDVATWWQQGGDVQQFDFTLLVEAVERATANSELVLLETHFGRQHGQLRPLIDLQLWLDVPFDIAFVRKAGQLCRQFAAGEPQDAVAALQWMADFCDAWLNVTRPMFTWQKSVIGGQSDERINAEPSVAKVLQQMRHLLPQAA
ncbi:MAG: AAA family ATPase [Planctomycetaceae bacterium]|nr:AAA family ATPase [Planctomycetaceae bacterium]